MQLTDLLIRQQSSFNMTQTKAWFPSGGCPGTHMWSGHMDWLKSRIRSHGKRGADIAGGDLGVVRAWSTNIFNQGQVPQTIWWKEYSIAHIPYPSLLKFWFALHFGENKNSKSLSYSFWYSPDFWDEMTLDQVPWVMHECWLLFIFIGSNHK